MNIDDYIPALPTPVGGIRGTYQYVSPTIIRAAFRHQHGTIWPRCFSSRYILPDDGWMHEALSKFHAFNLAVTGKQPQYLYQTGVYVCMEFAWDFNPGERHLAELLKNAGYRTVLIGTSHESPRSPEVLGFTDNITGKIGTCRGIARASQATPGSTA